MSINSGFTTTMSLLWRKRCLQDGQHQLISLMAIAAPDGISDQPGYPTPRENGRSIFVTRHVLVVATSWWRRHLQNIYGAYAELIPFI